MTNDERKEAILQLRAKGYSPFRIAIELRVSRNVVAGVLSRARKRGDARAGIARKTRPTPKNRPLQLGKGKPRLTVFRLPKPQPSRPPVPARPRGECAVLFLDVARAGQCRFPLWGDDTPFSEKFYCGNETDEAETYCPACRLFVYGPGTPSEQSAIRDARKAA